MSAPIGEHDDVEQRIHDATLDVHEMIFAVRELAETIRGQSNRQTVVVETKGLNAWGAAAVTACFCTLVGLLILAYVFGDRAGTLSDDVRDLKAWQQIHEKRLNQLEHKP